MVIDVRDRTAAPRLRAFGLQVAVLDTIMRTRADRGRLAAEVLGFATGLGAEGVSRPEALPRSA
jgi:hypothetical protein